MKVSRKIEHGNRLSSLPVDARIKIMRDAVSADQNVHVIISRGIRDRSPRVRATAVELISDNKYISFLDSLYEMVSDPSDLVRSEAIEALGVIEKGSGKHHEAIIYRLRDVKSIVQIAAIESLTQLRDSAAIPNIGSCLEDRNSLVRAYAAIALAELGGSACLPRISKALAIEQDEAAAAGFMIAIRLLGDDTKFSLLLGMLSSNQYQVRCFVANWLPRLALRGKDLRAARASVERALHSPLARADKSTMSGVLKQLA